MKKHLFFGAVLASLSLSAQVGIKTATPQKTFHVNGSLQVVNEVNVGGNATTAGSPGTTGQILTSQGAGAAPVWQSLNTVSGSINSAMYVQGTTGASATAGQTIDVPGVTATVTVPAGRTQTFLFTIIGYALDITTSTTSQGVFTLLQDGVKISSAYVSKAGIFPNSAQGTSTPASFNLGGLVNMPVPVTFLKSVSLPAGTYTFKVQYVAWAGAASVNVVPSTFSGYNGDTEAMLTKMQILVYNN
ncbi:hypothetical protein [Chryseobacterium sp. 'Rf worker isolate 10']|uniref:hypothetical protein n=1 Tax=Chryseobacterium sp. 'Rf worker isolate 10' TaxID=2887348 RepID=UPI003D6DC86B